ncbi:hypothetical protein F5Y08DRAFT_200056 [Xylaria arbuscula]|uniref:Uncharacterized protein n=1 Tax=Xylaria arbuscula TaxID=114810 RepID=A0A9W8NHH8_9PEZI|nr:hypothetical protein F5Y08DRAFT_200056 [Xylaria arbuscula]KAJ3575753.1 hypothetical protein NPX13_g3924 [Xylaria arbuscula]
MSGSGGFYKYRCKYFFTHECPNWVYVNNTACAECSAQGREAEPAAPQAPRNTYYREVYVPRPKDGVMYYLLVEIPLENDQTENSNNQWYASNSQTQAQVPTTTSAIPGTAATSSTF